ncbi:hypothetical protein NFC81_09010 [Salinispirillum sp. LH 10-3-1]|uniref:Uncharacterized protein n=1 Tax=Salinispirillum sp. LH 10-3-1 TaxID=2952525 RepID=A0AB38YBW8_9GAMM
MDYFLAVVDFLKAALWPVVVAWSAWILKDNIEDLLVKHKGTEMRLKLKAVGDKDSEIQELVNKVEKAISDNDKVVSTGEIKSSLARISALASEMADLKKEIAGTFRMGSNSDGRYSIFYSGLIKIEVKIAPGSIVKKSHIPFPHQINDESAVVTFIGSDQPKITKISRLGMDVELPESNEKEIAAVIYSI